MIKTMRWSCAFLVFGLCLLRAGMPVPGEVESVSTPSPESSDLVRTVVGNDLDGIRHSEVNFKNIQAAWELWHEGLAQKTGLRAEHLFYSDLPSLAQDFADGKLDLVDTTSVNFLRMRPLIHAQMAEDLYGVVQDGKLTHRYMVLVRDDSAIDTLGQLKGATLLMKQNEKTGRLFLNTLLRMQDFPGIRTFFGTVQETETLSQAVLALFFHEGDACITTEAVFDIMTELNPQIGEQLIVLFTSPDIVNSVFFFHKDYDPRAKAAILDQALHLEDSEFGRQILKLYKIDRLIQLQEADLNPTRVLLKWNVLNNDDTSDPDYIPIMRRKRLELTNP